MLAGTKMHNPIIFKPRRVKGVEPVNAWAELGRKANGKAMRLRANIRAGERLAEQIGGRDTTREVVEHIPVEAPYVSPQRAAELQNRCWVGPTQTNTITGEVSHMVRMRSGDGFVTVRREGPAP